MATVSVSGNDYDGQEIIEEQQPIQNPPQEYNDLIATLPVETRTAPILLRQYQGFWWPESILPGIMDIQHHFKPRPTDLFIMSYPKAGTTWIKALAFALVTRGQCPGLEHHPLLGHNPHDCVPYMDEIFALGQAAKLEDLPSPRLLATHMPYSTLPESVTASGESKIVYVCRNPKDVLISTWHFTMKMMNLELETSSEQFAALFHLFCEGVIPYGPVWDHFLGYWTESLRRPDKVLFLKYEEMMKDPLGNVRKLAEFVGCPFSAEEEKEGVADEIIGLCCFDKLKDLEVNKKGKQGVVFQFANTAFFRNGEVGDWRKHMSPEMAERLDEIFRQKLAGSGLSL